MDLGLSQQQLVSMMYEVVDANGMADASGVCSACACISVCVCFVNIGEYRAAGCCKQASREVSASSETRNVSSGGAVFLNPAYVSAWS